MIMVADTALTAWRSALAPQARRICLDTLRTILSVAAAACCVGLGHANAGAAEAPDAAGADPIGQQRIWMSVGEHRVRIKLAGTQAAQALLARLPITLDMPDLNGNEKHAKLTKALPQRAVKPGTIRAGELMLWGTDTLVIFYETFDSPYSYTPLGNIEDPVGLADILGEGTAKVTFSTESK